MIKIFGTIKSYKNEIYIQGAKILSQIENDFILHMSEIMLVWSHLKGEISSLDVLISFKILKNLYKNF